MAGLTLRLAENTDHAALEALFSATSMGTRIRIGFERDPDYFLGSFVQADMPCVWAAFEASGRAVGLFSAGSRRVWLGEETSMRYLSDLRIHPDYQGSSFFARGFHRLRYEVFEKGEWAQTLVLEDNLRALDLLCSKRGGLPEYRPAGRYVSWLLPSQRIDMPRNLKVSRAALEDRDEMQILLDKFVRSRSFSGIVRLEDFGKPCWRDISMDDFLVARKSGALVGMMGLWDQRRFQRLKIHSYPPAISALRPLWNHISSIPLPKRNHFLPLRKATAIACQNDDPEILRALLAAALAGKDERLLLVGFSVEDPLTSTFQKLKARKAYGRHFLVGWDGKPLPWSEPFAFDVARI